nr:hypothetical protein [uncultured Agathobaculum sp.]
MLCTVVVCCISLCSRRDGETAVRRSGAGVAGETAGRLPPSADAGDTTGAVGACVLIAGDGGCTAVDGAGCTAVCDTGCIPVRGVDCLNADAAVCGCGTTGVTRSEQPAVSAISPVGRIAWGTGGAGGMVRLGGDTVKPDEAAGVVRLGWTADAVCPCAAVAAVTVAVGTTLDECPADSVGGTGGHSGAFCSAYPARISDKLLSLCKSVCTGSGDTGITGVARTGRDAVGCTGRRALGVPETACCGAPEVPALLGNTCSGMCGMAAAGCTGVTDSPGAVSARCIGMTGAWVPISVCGVLIRPKSAGSGGSAGDTGETIIRLTAFASDTLWF